MRDVTLKKDFFIGFDQVDMKFRLRPSALLNILQDMATQSADIMGFGYETISEKNLGWFLIKYHIEFSEYPSKVGNYTFFTEPRGVDRMMAMRDFRIYKDNNCIMRASSSWLLADMTTRSLVSIKDSLDMWPFEKREDDLKFEKIRLPETLEYREEFKVRYDDLDVNKHVNNANYIVWAMESLPFDFRNEHNIKSIDMYFKREALYGETIISSCSIDHQELTSHHSIVNKENDEELCLLLIKYI